jgi:hypothetical protein
MKKIALSILVICLSWPLAQAQDIFRPISANSGSSGSSSEAATTPSLVETAVKDAFFIIRQSYRLKDSAKKPKFYGWNGNDYFGLSYSLGIKTTTGYYTDDKALNPWKYDANYESYSANKTYQPVLSETKYRPFGTDTYTDLPFLVDSCKLLLRNFVHVRNSKIFSRQGFLAETVSGEQNGWLVWVVVDKSLELAGATSSFLVVNPSRITFENTQDTYPVTAPSVGYNKVVAGGAYLVPQASSGQITYKLTGLLSGAPGEQWSLVKIAGALSEVKAGANKDGLTPIDNSKKSTKKKKK